MQSDPFDHAPMLASYVGEVLRPPSDGASLEAILSAYRLKSELECLGFTIVPLEPDASMEAAYRDGWLRSFRDRYRALLKAGWPDSAPPPRPSG